LQQSTSDFINQNLGELAQANQVSQQNKQNYEQAMYNNAVQNAASQNALQGQMIGAGGAVAGAALGAAIII
jgi:3-oxoacyl-ACP reductase-like protein